tara:strand:- start:31464 stop:31730 length:267 start_codon:yes stop_codon:yes gene_type:complete
MAKKGSYSSTGKGIKIDESSMYTDDPYFNLGLAAGRAKYKKMNGKTKTVSKSNTSEQGEKNQKNMHDKYDARKVFEQTTKKSKRTPYL